MSETSRQGRGGDGLYRKRGFWYFRFIDWNGRRRAVATRTKVHSQAKTCRKEFLEAQEAGFEPTGSGRLLLKDAAARWLERRSLDTAASTKRTRAAHLKHIERIVGDLPLGRITGDVLRRYQIERREKEAAAPKTVNLETDVIVSILKENRLWARIKDDFRSLKETESPGRRLTDEELESLLRVAEERRDISVIFLVMRLALETGLRHKELRTLHVSDVDLKAGTVRIRRSGTKTDAGARTVPLTPLAVEIADDLLDRAAGLGSVEGEHFVFPGTKFARGKRVPDPTVPQLSFGDAWRTLKKLANVDKTLRIHDFRHHVATDLAVAGVASGVAMRLMGWVSLRVRRRYEHIQDEALRGGIEQMQAFRERRVEADREAERAAASAQPTVRMAEVIVFPARRSGGVA